MNKEEIIKILEEEALSNLKDAKKDSISAAETMHIDAWLSGYHSGLWKGMKVAIQVIKGEEIEY